jgi:hypothetical protein
LRYIQGQGDCKAPFLYLFLRDERDAVIAQVRLLQGSTIFSHPQISSSQKNLTKKTQQAGNQRKHGQNEKQ